MVNQERLSGVRRASMRPRVLRALTVTRVQIRSPFSLESRTNKRHPVSVMFEMPGGESHEGRLLSGIDDKVFVESQGSLPVGSEMFLRLATVSEHMRGEAVFQGTVVWQCTSEDQFKNGKGFGVSLQGCRPQPPVPTQTEHAPEAV